MTDRRVRRRQRLTAWLVAALLGAGGALTVVTPAHAASTCTLTFDYLAWPASDGRARWQVNATFTNTGTVQSTNWMAFLAFPTDATIPQYWNITRSPRSVTTWLPPYNKNLAPGGYAIFGYEVDTPD